MPTMDRVSEARAAHARGWALTPLIGKRPRLAGWQNADPPDEDTVTEWALTGNVGLRTGRVSGVVVVDIDPGADPDEVDSLGLEPTVTVRTGRGGWHLYYAAPDEPIRNSASRVAAHVDIRGEGGQVVYVGSIHPDTGATYEWRDGYGPGECPLAPLPPGVLARLLEEPPEDVAAHGPTASGRGLDAYVARVLGGVALAAEGARNDTLNRAAYTLGRLVPHELDEPTTLAGLVDAATRAGLPREEAARTAAGGLVAGKARPRERTPWSRSSRAGSPQDGAPIASDDVPPSAGGEEESAAGEAPPIRPFTDLGNAERLVAAHGQDLRFCHPWAKWLVWDGRRWRVDDTAEPMRRAAATARAMYAEAADIPEPQRRDALESWARKSESRDRAKAMLEVASSIAGIPVLPAELDRRHFALNVKNGTVNLETGELHAHNRERLITKLAPVGYSPDSVSPLWERFMTDIQPDPEVRAFLQRAVGWSISGDVSAQALFICYESGANGKSTFLNTLAAILGDYACTVRTDVFTETKSEQHPTAIADLAGKRFVTSIEVGELSRFNEGLLKSLTGGDPIRARRMREDFWQFLPTHHLWFGVNHKPTIRGTDHAIWRRVNLIPFPARFEGDRKVDGMQEKLMAEAPGILAWAVRGFRMWRERGLDPPASVCAATKEYASDSDILGAFIRDRCDLGSDTVSVASSELYRAYVVWAEQTGERRMAQRTFGIRLAERGFKSLKGSGGVRRWVGLVLLAPPPTEQRRAWEEGEA